MRKPKNRHSDQYKRPFHRNSIEGRQLLHKMMTVKPLEPDFEKLAALGVGDEPSTKTESILTTTTEE